jgi:hypothetical protein
VTPSTHFSFVIGRAMKDGLLSLAEQFYGKELYVILTGRTRLTFPWEQNTHTRHSRKSQVPVQWLKAINFSTQIKRQTKLSKDPALTISFKAVTTEWTWKKYERVEDQKVLSLLGCRQIKSFPSSRRGVVRLGLEPSQCSATASTVYLKSNLFSNVTLMKQYCNTLVHEHREALLSILHINHKRHSLSNNVPAYSSQFHFPFHSLRSLRSPYHCKKKQENIQDISNVGYTCATVLQNITLTGKLQAVQTIT